MEYSSRRHETWEYASDSNTHYVSVLKSGAHIEFANSREELLELAGELPPPEEDIDLVSDEIKFLIPVSDSFYHFFVESLGIIYKLHKERPGSLLVIYVINLYKPKFTDNVEQLLRVFLDREKANYRIIRVKSENRHSPVVKVNNSVRIWVEDHSLTSSLLDVVDCSEALVKCAREFLGVEKDDFPPTKKVFLTGFPHFKFDFIEKEQSGALIGFRNDERMYDREKLEEFFSSLGYEIVNPEEDFETLFHQIHFMSQVKTLAAVTCSGLGNMLFMKPGQLVVEIQAEVCQLKPGALEVDKVQTFQSIHPVYATTSYMKHHFLISVPSRRDPDQVIEKLRGSKILELL